jgi:hypothetical protein
MGGGNSVENISKTFTSSVTNSAINSTQTASEKESQKLLLNVDCSDATWADEKGKYSNQCYTTWAAVKPRPSAKFLKTVCNDLWSCGANQVSMKNVMHMDSFQNNKADISQTAKNSLQNTVQATAKQKTGFFQIKNKTTDDVESSVKNVNNLAISALEQAIQSSTQNTMIVAKGAPIKYVTTQAVQDSVVKQLNQDKNYQAAVTGLASQVKALSDQSSGTLGGSMKIFVYIAIGLVIIAIIVGIVSFIIRKSRKKHSEDTDSNHHKIVINNYTRNDPPPPQKPAPPPPPPQKPAPPPPEKTD